MCNSQPCMVKSSQRQPAAQDMAERCVTWHTWHIGGQRSIFAGKRAFVCWSHLRDGARRFSGPLSACVVCRNHCASAQRAEE